MKKCSTCKDPKNLTEFYRDARQKDGHEHRCKVCCRARRTRAYWADPEKAREASHQYRVMNPEKVRLEWAQHRAKFREQRRAYAQAWHATHREHEREWNRLYWRAHPKQKQAVNKRYDAKHPDKARARRQRQNAKPSVKLLKSLWKTANPEQAIKDSQIRRARLAGDPSPDRITRAALWIRDGGRCHLCKDLVTLKKSSIDHLIPVSAGGWHRWVNVALACLSCNIKRNAGRIPAQLRLLG